MSPNHDFLKKNLINILKVEDDSIKIDILIYFNVVLLKTFAIPSRSLN